MVNQFINDGDFTKDRKISSMWLHKVTDASDTFRFKPAMFRIMKNVTRILNVAFKTYYSRDIPYDNS